MLGASAGMLWGRIKEVGKVLLWSLVILLALCLAVCFVVLIKGGADTLVVDACGNQSVQQMLVSVWDVLDWLFRYRTDPCGSLEAMNENLQLLFHASGIMYQTLVTGFVLEVLITPVRLVDFSRYLVIDPNEKCLVLRYWIKLCEKEYLTDASIDVLFETDVSRNDGSSSKHFEYRFIDPQDSEGGIDTYFGIRGVRTTEMSLDAKCMHGSGKTLRDVLIEVGQDNGDCRGGSERREWSIRARVKGQAPSGANLMYEKVYSVNDILIDYDFVSIRRDEIEAAAGLRRVGGKRRWPPRKARFQEHLSVVTRGDMECGLWDSMTELRDCFWMNHPPCDLFVIGRGEHVSASFMPKAFVVNACEWLRRHVPGRIATRVGSLERRIGRSCHSVRV